MREPLLAPALERAENERCQLRVREDRSGARDEQILLLECRMLLFRMLECRMLECRMPVCLLVRLLVRLPLVAEEVARGVGEPFVQLVALLRTHRNVRERHRQRIRSARAALDDERARGRVAECQAGGAHRRRGGTGRCSEAKTLEHGRRS
jgi:hypothetical protein